MTKSASLIESSAHSRNNVTLPPSTFEHLLLKCRAVEGLINARSSATIEHRTFSIVTADRPLPVESRAGDGEPIIKPMRLRIGVLKGSGKGWKPQRDGRSMQFLALYYDCIKGLASGRQM